MKKCTLLLLLLAVLLSGCGAAGQRIKEPVTFYYIMEEYQYGKRSGVFASEEREAAGHREDLAYLLALYLIGPSEDGLISPIPDGTKIFSLESDDTALVLRLSDTTDTMSDADFTRAGACLTLTCFELTNAETVTVQSGSRSVTMSRDNLIFIDDSLTAESKEEK